jgi:polyphosphate kinase
MLTPYFIHIKSWLIAAKDGFHPSEEAYNGECLRGIKLDSGDSTRSSCLGETRVLDSPQRWVFVRMALGILQMTGAVSADGMSPAEQLAAIRKVVTRLMVQTEECFLLSVLPVLTRAGIHVLNYGDLTERQQTKVKNYFDEIVFPVLTPLAFDPGRPFPHISNLSLNLAILIRDQEGVEHFARLKVPDTLPQLVPIKRSSGSLRKDGTVPYNHYFVWLDQVIVANLTALFPGTEILEAHPFHVIRNADMVIQELEADDLLETMEASVRQRRFGRVVKVAVNKAMPPPMLIS